VDPDVKSSPIDCNELCGSLDEIPDDESDLGWPSNDADDNDDDIEALTDDISDRDDDDGEVVGKDGGARKIGADGYGR